MCRRRFFLAHWGTEKKIRHPPGADFGPTETRQGIYLPRDICKLQSTLTDGTLRFVGDAVGSVNLHIAACQPAEGVGGKSLQFIF